MFFFIHRSVQHTQHIHLQLRLFKTQTEYPLLVLQHDDVGWLKTVDEYVCIRFPAFVYLPLFMEEKTTNIAFLCLSSHAWSRRDLALNIMNFSFFFLG